MKTSAIILGLLLSFSAFAQKQTATNGKIYGRKPDTAAMLDASKLEGFMGRKVSVSTTIKGRVKKVTKTKGGWFTIDAGNGKEIAAHFQSYGTNIPVSLAGHYVVVQGVAAKQFLADDLQHFAGDTVTGKKQHVQKRNANHVVSFAVTGLMVER